MAAIPKRKQELTLTLATLHATTLLSNVQEKYLAALDAKRASRPRSKPRAAGVGSPSDNLK